MEKNKKNIIYLFIIGFVTLFLIGIFFAPYTLAILFILALLAHTAANKNITNTAKITEYDTVTHKIIGLGNLATVAINPTRNNDSKIPVIALLGFKFSFSVLFEKYLNSSKITK